MTDGTAEQRMMSRRLDEIKASTQINTVFKKWSQPRYFFVSIFAKYRTLKMQRFPYLLDLFLLDFFLFSKLKIYL